MIRIAVLAAAVLLVPWSAPADEAAGPALPDSLQRLAVYVGCAGCEDAVRTLARLRRSHEARRLRVARRDFGVVIVDPDPRAVTGSAGVFARGFHPDFLGFEQRAPAGRAFLEGVGIAKPVPGSLYMLRRDDRGWSVERRQEIVAPEADSG